MAKINITLIIYLLGIFNNFFIVKTNPIVKTLSGKIKGYYQKSFKGREFKSFEGIPYAEPPVGALRFQPPENVSPWDGVLLAERPESECLQHSHRIQIGQDIVHGSEDCLYLNIYVPTDDDNSTKLLPVLFYIHSGAFQFGNGHENRPEYLMDRKVVYVTINYRLGMLGFLSTGDDVVPGNMGLKDQNLALRWISDNIKFFGGDSEKITLVGLSAGAASVHYHYLSPLSRGLFHGGISLSGTALDCWTQTGNSEEKTKKLADILGCPTHNTKRMIKCLMTRPAKSIVQLLRKFMPWLYNPYTPFGPVVEKNSSKPFIDRSPIDIIASGDAANVPWLTSVTSEEGLYPELNENWDEIAPHLLDYNYTIPKSKQSEVSNKIKKHYLGDEKIGNDTVKPLIQLIGDRLYVVDAVKAAKMMAKTNSVWFYLYSHRGQYSLSDLFTTAKQNLGASHADDNMLIVYSPTKIFNATDIIVQNVLLDIWESFATTGVPDAGSQWLKVDELSDAIDYLQIAGPNNVTMKKNSNLGDGKFWQSIDFNENKISSNFS
ncbi:hypothetical protein HCN44_005069 [Aphidius gifuensis]|uniref:Carboxylic ester hydrolase n=1 Tax=Aphidius gifuensis TaxID=684658 RepID=A0A834XVA4_APHGI|nr:hypothetical protein HCN44_005069 [Aphidius gifuensis]